ncbi:excisionase family DNA-binding protein [Nocardiopsis sp. CNT-189]|uniref:excisionase family DNA-binding protein n=1 Tax=Nocardiopsis oceanisediminis TaxID=2816862 RepID=UPI003B2BD60B
MMNPITTEKKLLRVEDAAKLLGIGRTRTFEQIRLGRLRSVKLGTTRLVPAEALDEFVALLISESAEGAAA